MEERHSPDLRHVKEDDDVTLTTTTGDTLRATCTNTDEMHADPQSGEVVTTSVWTFKSPDLSSAADVGITDGLKSSPEQDDFPRYDEMYCDTSTQTNFGYINSVEVHGRPSDE